MSYILDALRRAEAQRSRGAVPTLHAPVLDAGRDPGLAGPARRRWLVWLMLAGALVAALVVAWRMAAPRPGVSSDIVAQTLPSGVTSTAPTGPMAAPPPPPARAPSGIPPDAIAPSMSPATEAGPPLVPQPPSTVAAVVATAPPSPSVFGAEVPRSSATPSASPSAPALPRRAEPGPDPSRGPRPLLTLRSTEPPPPLPPAPTSNNPPGGPPAAPAAPSPADGTAQPSTRLGDAAIPPRRDLPPEVQRELPALAVSGIVYSSDRAQRMVIVNGELMHEGDRIGPELQLEEIRRKEAVLRYRGQRFSISP